MVFLFKVCRLVLKTCVNNLKQLSIKKEKSKQLHQCRHVSSGFSETMERHQGRPGLRSVSASLKASQAVKRIVVLSHNETGFDILLNLILCFNNHHHQAQRRQSHTWNVNHSTS